MNETNLINALLANRQGQSDTLVIVGMILQALSPILSGVAAWLAAQAVRNTAKIEHSVNSERENMVKKVDGLRDEIRVLASDKATLAEANRGQQLAAALATTAPRDSSPAPEVIPKSSVAGLHKAVQAVPKQTTDMVVDEIATVVADKMSEKK